jgi:hypothetical protein
MEYFNSDGARTGLFFGALPMRCPMHLEYTSLKNRIPILITVTSGPRRS